ncbi:MAG: PhnD/SsuA/transferrin family substrate-binding protein [Sulfitobacter sp.]
MIASLMMYARPELEAAHRRYWALIRAELAARGIESPETLSNDVDGLTVWNDSDLVLSQTCGMPYRLWLKDKVTLVGTPDFGLEGCPPGYYRSAIVVRADDPRKTLADFAQALFAYNARYSQSGFASIYNTVSPLGFWFSDKVESGGHVASARMVAQGTADIAALDAVTWRLIRKYEAFSDKLRVLEWTVPTPGLPYIAAAEADRDATFAAIKQAIAQLAPSDRTALGIKDLIAIPEADYLAVGNPPEEVV